MRPPSRALWLLRVITLRTVDAHPVGETDGPTSNSLPLSGFVVEVVAWTLHTLVCTVEPVKLVSVIVQYEPSC
jgi:hypothetical protein